MSKLSKRFKAIIMDVDGTLIPNRKDGMPSPKVERAIALANKIIHVGVATSRPLFVLLPVLENINLSGPSIVNGGAQIVDFPSLKILWEKTIAIEDLRKITNLLNELKRKFVILDNGMDLEYDKNYKPNKPIQIWIHDLSLEEADKLIEIFSGFSNLAILKTPSWAGDDRRDLVMNHALATKQHGIFEVAKILNIDTDEIIGVGDGYNDFPLLMACGLKVAMGNAVPEIRVIADYIAPSVDEDGVVDVINKFVLMKE